jgi:ATP adenylyltransferase
MDRLWAPWRARYVEQAGRDEPSGCFLCEYATRGSDSERHIVRRWAHWYAVLNAFPYTNGHLMLVLSRHEESFAALRPEEGAELAQALGLCEAALRHAYQPHGLNLGVNIGRAAGAGAAGHLHIHLLPRWHGDTNFMTSVGEPRVVPEDLEQSDKRLREAFARREGS